MCLNSTSQSHINANINISKRNAEEKRSLCMGKNIARMLFHTHSEPLPEVISIGPEPLYPLAQDPEVQVRLGREGVPPPRMRLRSSLSLFPDGLKWTFPRRDLRHFTFAFFVA
ncbi:hypothetical protein RRG08_035848 [Elysia crispata]|uniref:Uncharacterized protein n=1 Tax=Elysia crispata TaxID=231223 RepID=A0AAE0Z6W3_9GAST|nr:hypothetical protein RRG08_035848 [Elysia crispata]